MAPRKIVFAEGEYYHIYNRGANREVIFRNAENYQFLLRQVKKYATEWQIANIAYCLMSNHYHFVWRQDGAKPISGCVQAIFNSYTKAFNKMYSRSGTLLEGPFRARHITTYEYLIHVCRYVHRNPLEAKLVTNLNDWPYSNYLEWIDQRQGTLVDREFVRSHFPKPSEYTKFVVDYTPSERMEHYVRDW